MIPFADLTHYQAWVPFLGGTLVPFLVSLLTQLRAKGTVKAAVAVVLLAVTAVGTYLLDVGQSHTWKGTVAAFVTALIAAGVTRVVLTGGLDTRLAKATETFGFGKPYRNEGVAPTLPVGAPDPVHAPSRSTPTAGGIYYHDDV